MSDTQSLKSEVVKALEVGLELAIDEFLALEASLISSMTASESRRVDLRLGGGVQPRIDNALHASPELVAAKMRMQKLAAATAALRTGGWEQTAPCGDHGGALSAPRTACSTCQSDAAKPAHKTYVYPLTHTLYCLEHGGDADNSKKYCPACQLPDVSVISGGTWSPNK